MLLATLSNGDNLLFSKWRNSFGIEVGVSGCRLLGCGEALLSDSLSQLVLWRVERLKDVKMSGSVLRLLGVVDSPVVGWLSVDCGVGGFKSGGLGDTSSWFLWKKEKLFFYILLLDFL